MRKLLIVLLFVMEVAQTAAVVPILGIDKAPLLAKLAPLLMAVCAVISAIMLIKKSGKAIIPYLVGFAGFLVMEIVTFGPSMLQSSALGFVVAILFLLPSVRAPK